MASVGKVSIYSSQALTATTTSSAMSMDQRWQKLFGYIKCTALGAGTSLAVKIQHSPDGTNWFDWVSFTALVAAGSEIKYPTLDIVAPQIRVVATFTGGTTTGTVTVELFYDPFKG